MGFCVFIQSATLESQTVPNSSSPGSIPRPDYKVELPHTLGPPVNRHRASRFRPAAARRGPMLPAPPTLLRFFGSSLCRESAAAKSVLFNWEPHEVAFFVASACIRCHYLEFESREELKLCNDAAITATASLPFTIQSNIMKLFVSARLHLCF